MWDQAKQARFDALRASERQSTLNAAERAELVTLTQELDALEAAYLAPAAEQVRQERAALEVQNQDLGELLCEQRAYLADLRTVVTELEAREQQWRKRIAEITGREWAPETAEVSG